MAVTYTSDYSTDWFSGSSTADASVVPGKYMVAINGRPYMINSDPQAIEDYGNNFKEESLPLMRAQADQAKTPAEQSLSPTQFWRRGQETWHKGAGQAVLDREDSDPARFNTSLGVNPWTRYQLALLRDVDLRYNTTNTNLHLAVGGGGRVYVADGNGLQTINDIDGLFAPVTGTPAAPVIGLASSGNIVFAGYGASGIYTVTGTVATSYVTDTVDAVGYAKGRLLAAAGQNLYNPTAAGALPAALTTHPDTGWTWQAFAEGNACIYAAGYAGSTSRIYRIGISETTGALGVAIVAASLPDGEIVRALLGYMGFLIIGTDRGVRFATAETSGDLTLGALIPTAAPVRCLDARDQFVWFGWTNYTATKTGLGRLDLTTINEGLAPAYASDLMNTSQGDVTGVVHLGARTIFSVAGVGVRVEATRYVASGTLTTGQITYGLADPKVAVQVDLKHARLITNTSVAAAASYDRNTATALGSSATPGTVSPVELIGAGKTRHEEAELTLTLTASAAGADTPILTRWTLMSYPAPSGASLYVLPLLLFDRILTLRDTEEALNPLHEYQFLTALHGDREIVTVQVGADVFEGVLEDYVWLPNAARWQRDFFNGTFIAKIRRIAG